MAREDAGKDLPETCTQTQRHLQNARDGLKHQIHLVQLQPAGCFGRIRWAADVSLELNIQRRSQLFVHALHGVDDLQWSLETDHCNCQFAMFPRLARQPGSNSLQLQVWSTAMTLLGICSGRVDVSK